MKPTHFLIAGAAALASAACNAEQQPQGTSGGATGPVQTVERPASGDWSEAVTMTNEGGFVMGNPNARVKLVEFGSMTCPACAAFDETGMPPLIDKYVKSGRVSFEFRNFVRDPFDLTASLVARCGGTASFFALTRALFADQSNWFGRIQGVTPEQNQAMQAMAPAQQFGEIAKIAGFSQFAAMRGVPSAKTSACLADESEINRLVQMNSETTNQYPNFTGTPAFVINGKMLDKTANWQTLEPQLKAALGS